MLWLAPVWSTLLTWSLLRTLSIVLMYSKPCDQSPSPSQSFISPLLLSRLFCPKILTFVSFVFPARCSYLNVTLQVSSNRQSQWFPSTSSMMWFCSCHSGLLQPFWCLVLFSYLLAEVTETSSGLISTCDGNIVSTMIFFFFASILPIEGQVWANVYQKFC